MNFFINNIYNALLLGVAVISGAALLVPLLLRRGVKVTPLQATQLINQGKTLVLDVRESAEFATGHLRDAKNIPLKELSSKLAQIDKFKAKPVLVTCPSGIQSAKAAAILSKAGFSEVVSLNGGLAAWVAQGLPIVK